MKLSSGFLITGATERLLQFCREEYAYYDGLPIGNPDRVEPLDVLAAISVNGIVGASASRVRSIHSGLSNECEPLLKAIPSDANLVSFDPQLEAVRALLDAALRVKWVLVPVATKVLHRKRPNFIPMLDNVILAHYLETMPGASPSATQEKPKAARIAVDVMRQFRRDLEANSEEVETMRLVLARAGFQLSPVRILEILVWTEVEKQGYYQ